MASTHPPARGRSSALLLLLAAVLAAAPALAQDRVEPDSALAALRAELLAARGAGDPAAEAEALHRLGTAEGNAGAADSALAHLHGALRLRRQAGDATGEGRTLNNIGSFYHDAGQADSAAAYFTAAVAAHARGGNRRFSADALNNLGLVREAERDFDGALEQYRAALVLARDVSDEELLGKVLQNVGDVHAASDRPDSAVVYIREAMLLRRARGARVEESLSAAALGSAYQDLQQHDSALVHYRASLAIDRELGDRYGQGWLLRRIGDVHRVEARGDSALAAYREAMAIYDELGDTRRELDTRRFVRFLAKSAFTSQQHSRWLLVPRKEILSTDSIDGVLDAGTAARDAEGRPYHDHPVRLAAGHARVTLLATDEAPATMDPELTLISPSGRELRNDDYISSISESRVTWRVEEPGTWTARVASHEPGYGGGYLLEVERLTPEGAALTVRMEEAFITGLRLMVEADGHRRASRYAEARVRADSSLQVLEAVLGPDHAYLAEPLAEAADMFESLGSYAEARGLYERSIAIRERVLGAENPLLARSLNGLALLVYRQGDTETARRLWERVLAIYQAEYGTHGTVADVLHRLANLRHSLGDHAAARDLYVRTIAIRDSTAGPRSSMKVGVLVDFAYLQMDMGAHAGARPLLDRALEILEAEEGEDAAATAPVLSAYAQLLRSEGRFEEARELLVRALEMRESIRGPDHPWVAGNLVQLALLDWETGARDPAPLLLRAADARARHASAVLPTLAMAEQAALLGGDLHSQTSVLLSYGGEALEQGYALLAGWKGLLLEGLRRQAAIGKMAGDPAHAGAVAELRALRTEIAAWQQHAGRTSEEEWTARQDSLTAAKEQLERSLAAAVPAAELSDPWADGGYLRLRALLPGDAAFIDLYRYLHYEAGEDTEDHYAAVVTGAGAPARLVRLGAAASVDSLIARWRNEVAQGLPASESGAALRDAVWRPIAATLPAGAARVWISGDAQLARIPWRVVAGERVAVAEISSARTLLRALSDGARERREHTGPSLLLVGGVDFSAAPSARDGGAGRSVEAAPELWTALPGTRSEVAALERLADSADVATVKLTEQEPTPAQVVHHLPRSRWAHLATHGFFFTEMEPAGAGTRAVRGFEVGSTGEQTTATVLSRNPLAESGLALAGANHGAAGTLTAEELVGLDLSALELVVLSACDTGRGAEITGQGVMGLRASLEAAGVSTLVMSLWKVPDESTALLMQHFYRGVWEEGLPPADALRRAQDAVRAEPRFSAPLHWAAWVLAGRAWS